LYPALFSNPPKPLKLRIQADIQARSPGVFTKPQLSAFLRRYTGSYAYLTAMVKATHRFDLDGNPGDELSPEHRQAAIDELARRRQNQQARRAVEEEQRRNRATLLRDFERTTLTPANFSALKGVPLEELEPLLARARQEAAEAPPAFERDRRGPPNDRAGGPERHDRRERPGQGERAGGGQRPPREARGDRPQGPRPEGDRRDARNGAPRGPRGDAPRGQRNEARGQQGPRGPRGDAPRGQGERPPLGPKPVAAPAAPETAPQTAMAAALSAAKLAGGTPAPAPVASTPDAAPSGDTSHTPSE
jgi:hypothetical protein